MDRLGVSSQVMRSFELFSTLTAAMRHWVHVVLVVHVNLQRL